MFYSKIEDQDDWYIDDQYIEPYPHAKREGEVISQIGTLNQLIAGRYMEEWKDEGSQGKRQIYHQSFRDIQASFILLLMEEQRRHISCVGNGGN